MAIRLFDLFPGLAAAWPRDRVRFETGDIVVGPDEASVSARLTLLNAVVEVLDPRFGAEDGVAMEARLRVDNGPAPGAPFLLALKAMPRVGIRLLNTDPVEPPRLLVSRQDDGVEIVIEALPVRIELPPGFVHPVREDDRAPYPPPVERGTFFAGHLDTQRIVYRHDEPTSIDVHVRVVVDKDLDVVIVPALPITFGPCAFSELPVKGAFDFHLLPSPGKARRWLPWIRHDVSAWFGGVVGDFEGAFAVRHLWLDPQASWLKRAAEWLNEHGEEGDPSAEFVIDDLVVPFVLPIPRHVTLGLRRSLEDVADVGDVAAFTRAPLVVYFTESSPNGFLVNELFLRSQSVENLLTDGLRVDLAFFFGRTLEDGAGGLTRDPTWSLGLQLLDEGTLLLAYARDLDNVGDTPILDWRLGSTQISIVRVRAGVSIARLARGESFGSSFVLVVDVLITEEAEAGDEDGFPVKIEGLSGAPLQVLLEGVGWWFEPAIEGAGFPSGMQITFADVFRIMIEEISIATRENGGHYLVISAGLGFEGDEFGAEFGLRGMRFRLGGNPDAPFFGVDGFFLKIVTEAFLVDVAGYFEDRREGGLRIQEFGLSGTLALYAYEVLVAIDLIIGRITGAQNFRYFMVQAYVSFVVTIGYLELLSIRGLFAFNMQPALSPADEQSRELRYYQWYRRTDPTTVAGNRRLDAWEAQQDAWGLGIGVGMSFTGMGEIAKFRVFILGVDRPAGAGFLFAGEAFLLEGDEPVGYFVVEWDGEQDRFSLLVGVDITIDKFVEEVPSWLGNVLSLTGTLLISTSPTIVALGRLRDPLTWLRLRLDVDLWLARSFVEAAMCFEVQTSPEEVAGTAIAIRMAGAGVVGPGLLEFYVGWGLLISTFNTGSQAYAAELWIECGIRYRLFFFLNFGVHVGGAVKLVGPDPAFAIFELFLQIETPWFLPDVELRIEKADGQLAPAEIATATAPLRSASTLVEATGETARLFVSPPELVAISPTAPASAETERPPVRTLAELRTLPMPDRDTRAEAFRRADLPPIPTDATVQVAFVVPVNDGVGLAVPPPATRTQAAGDLTLRYDVVGFEVRRRPRWTPGAPWVPLAERVELAVALGPGGSVTGAFDPLPLSAFWEDVAVGTDSVAQRLLLNATTPFTFVLGDEAADESLLERNPDWPCCPPDPKGGDGPHVLTFHGVPPGEPVPPTLWFEGTRSVLRSLYRSLVRPSSFAGGPLPLDTPAALYTVQTAGTLFRTRFDAPVAWVDVRVGWLTAFTDAVLALVLADDAGEIARTELALRGLREPAVVRLAGPRPATECEAHVRVPAPPPPLPPVAGGATVSPDAPVATTLPMATVEVDRVAYLLWEELVAAEAAKHLCGSVGARGFGGAGKIGFLPNHEYEIALTTRVTVAHPTSGPEEAELTQFVYFHTKGLPGLNAAPRVGAELEPYVAAAYPPVDALIYASEPVALAFTEQLNVVVPLADRPAGPAAVERDVLLELSLALQPDVAETRGTAASATAPDWVVAHRASPLPPSTRVGGFRYELTPAVAAGRTALSADGRRARLAALVDRPGATCDAGDPRVAPAGLLVHPPAGAGTPADPLWRVGRHTATVRAKDAPFVDRQPFQPGDQTAFEYRADGGAAAPGWSLTAAGELEAAGAGRRYALFGEPAWDHVEVQAGILVEGTAAGLLCAVPAGSHVHGWAALIEQEGGEWFLALRRRAASDAAWELGERVALPGFAADRPAGLRLTVFDDRLRAVVGETQVEVLRGGQRAGRLGLLADGATRVTSLRVRGLTLYQFGVQVSRYRDFDAHIGSFAGRVDDVQPAAMGAAPGRRRPTSWPADGDGDRPPDDAGGGPRRAPGAIRRVGGGAGRPLPADGGAALPERLPARRRRARARAGEPGAVALHARGDSDGRALVPRAPSRPRSRHRGRPPRRRGAGAGRGAGARPGAPRGLRARGGRRPGRAALPRVRGPGEPRGERVRFRSDVSYVVEPTSSRGRSLADALRGARVGAIGVLDRRRDVVVEAFDPGRVVTVPVPLVVLADAPQRNALLVPSAGGGPPMPAGTYRLHFRIDRERWPDLAGGIPGQRLSDAAILDLRL